MGSKWSSIEGGTSTSFSHVVIGDSKRQRMWQ